MVLPLLIIVLLWNKLGQRGQSALRGRVFTFLGRQWHTTSVVTGLLVILVGIVFWTTNGLVGVPQLVPDETQAWLQESACLLRNPIFDIVMIIMVAAVVLLMWWKRQRSAQ